MDESEVEEGDCLGVSLGDPAAVEGAEFSVVEVTVRRRTVRLGIAVEAIVRNVCVYCAWVVVGGIEAIKQAIELSADRLKGGKGENCRAVGSILLRF
jgi:hypothetical protein